MKAPLGVEVTTRKSLIANTAVNTLNIQKKEILLPIGVMRYRLQFSVVWNHTADLGKQL